MRARASLARPLARGSWMGPDDDQASIRDRESNSARVPYGDSTDLEPPVAKSI